MIIVLWLGVRPLTAPCDFVCTGLMIIVLWLGVRPRAAPCDSDTGIAMRKAVHVQRAVPKSWSWTRPTADRSFMYHSDSRANLDRCDGRSCDKLAPEAQSVRSVVARWPSRAVSVMLATRTKIVHPGGTIIKVRQRSAVTVVWKIIIPFNYEIFVCRSSIYEDYSYDSRCRRLHRCMVNGWIA